MRERILFLQAIKITDPAERRAFLEGACRGDGQLLERIESLVALSGSLGQFLDPAQKNDPSNETREWENPANTPDLSFLSPTTRTEILGLLAHYEIREVIGQGAFGIVLGGWDTKLERDVAIKVLMPHLAKTSPPRKRFLREARAGAAIRHPNVIQVFAVEEEPIPYIVMERVRGRTLQECIDDEGPLDCSQILPIAVQLTQALSASHATGLIHRDVKPTNVLIESGRNPRAVLTDFGLARTVDDASLTQSGFVAGTPMYMSPEQSQGQTLDARSDQFSLGSVLYLMITGRPPFRASSVLGVMRRVAEANPRVISEINPDAPAWFCALIERMMQKNPQDRFASLDSVAAVIQDAQREWIERGTMPGGKQLNSKQVDAPKLSSIDLWRLLWLGGAVPLAIMLALGVWLTQRRDSETPSTTEISSEETAQSKPPISMLEQAKIEFVRNWPSDAPPPAIVPFSRSQATEFQKRWADYMGVPVDYEDPLGTRFRLIPPGIFLMGSSQEDIDRSLVIAGDDANWKSRIMSETPQHWVVITHPYYVSATEVTQSLYEDVMATNPAHFRAGGPGAGALKSPDTRKLPVESISWSQSVDLCRRMNQRLQLPTAEPNDTSWGGSGWPGSYGLLTEAQWEFACRAGTSTRYWTGDYETELGQSENVNSIVQITTPVGSYPPNPFGLHDMHGNVYEHVFDLLSLTQYQVQSASVSIDPSGAEESPVGHRVIRGGDWYWPSATSRSASRTDHDPNVAPGFHTGARLALNVPTVKRLLTARKTLIAIEAREIHGADFPSFRRWLESLQTKYIPTSINIRSGSDPILFDGVAVKNRTGVDWQVHEVKDDEGAHLDFQAMNDTHACLWRTHLYADVPPADQPGILLLWVASKQNWQTWWGDPDGMLDEIHRDSLAGWLPTSISLSRSPTSDRIMHSRTLQPGVGHRAHFDVSLEELRELVQEYRQRGWRPHLMQVQVGGKDFRCVCVFRENRDLTRWDVSMAITNHELEEELERRRKEGFYPLHIGSYVQADTIAPLEPRYVVVWMEASTVP
jgi:serine/threonine protein kinase